MPSFLHRLLSLVRHTPDRLLHPVRRRAARRGLARRDDVRSVLFVCHGNICRSPYAEELFRQALADRGLADAITVHSGGFVGPDRPSPPEALEVAGERDIDLTHHRSKPVSATRPRADLAVCMEPRQKTALARYEGYDRSRVLILGDLDPQPIRKRVILDPFGRSIDSFRRSYDRVDRCMEAFIDVFPFPAQETSAAPTHGEDRPR